MMLKKVQEWDWIIKNMGNNRVSVLIIQRKLVTKLSLQSHL